jgi:hypothetical protein
VIDNMNFNKSDAIQRILDDLGGDNCSAIVAKYGVWLRDGIYEALFMLDANIESLWQEMFDQELQYRRDIDTLLATTQE